MTESSESTASKFLPLRPVVFEILLSLNQGERHGYGIIQDAAERTEGGVSLEMGTLYRALRRMVDQGLVEESDRRPAPEADDERRRYYRATGLGKKVAAAEARRLEELVEAARSRDLLEAPGRA